MNMNHDFEFTASLHAISSFPSDLAFDAGLYASHEPVLLDQIQNLRRRIQIIKHMQSLGVLSMMLCVVSMTLLFFENQPLGQTAFGVSLLLMIGSLALSLKEIQMSGAALDMQLRDIKCD